MKTKAKKVAPVLQHDVRRDVCVVCGRVGGYLKIPCPGYKTAAEAGTRAKDK
jgi:hypothetical protein